MVKPSFKVVMLLAVFATGCTEESATTEEANVMPFADGPPVFTRANVNGNLTGEIWVADDFLGTERFNLTTGKQTKLMPNPSFPSKDGSEYLEYIEQFDDVFDLDCEGEIIDIHKISVKDTRSDTENSSFLIDRSVSGPFRLSPDGERMAMQAAEISEDCEPSTRNQLMSVFSRNGDELFRGHFDIASYDWHPDGRLVLLVYLGKSKYEIQIETSVGSHEFTPTYSFSRPPEVLYYVGLRIGPSGNDALIEGVTEPSDEFAPYAWRAAKVYQFDLYEPTLDSEMFEYASDDVRVNAPIYSPDGKFILVTEGYAEGSHVRYTNHPDLGLLDSVLMVPVFDVNTSFVVPVRTRKHVMPPMLYTEKIRPVFAYANEEGEDTFSTVGFTPIHGLTWTPLVE